MKDTELFKKLLNLVEPWTVESIESKIEDKEIIIKIAYPERIEGRCPKCGKNSVQYDHPNVRQWRHLDTMQFKTIIECSVPRIECREHGVLKMEVPWAGVNSRFTELFERFAIDVLLACKTNQRAGELLQISWDEIHQIKKKAINRGLKRRELENIEFIGIDEKSFLKGHEYATILTDIENSRVLEVVQERTEEKAREIINKTLDEEKKKGIKAVSVDMWQAFMNASEKEIPEALIVHDLFHISKYLNEGVNKVRAKENRELLKSEIDSLIKTKWIWVKDPNNWTEKEKDKFEIIREGNFKVARAWEIKEQFKGICFMKTIEEGKEYFKKWYKMAMESELPEMIKVANTLQRHIEGILNYIKYKITNAMSEGMNSLIQGLKTVARGYRNFENFRIAILFHYGKLSLYP